MSNGRFRLWIQTEAVCRQVTADVLTLVNLVTTQR